MSTEPFTIHRCTECGEIRRSRGSLHAHIDAKHRGWGPFNILPPVCPGPGHYPTLMKYTEVIDVYDDEVGFDGQSSDHELLIDGSNELKEEA